MPVLRPTWLIMLGKVSILSLLTLLFANSERCLAVTKSFKNKYFDFQYDPSIFQSELHLPMSVVDRPIPLAKKSLSLRLDKYTSNHNVEPLQLTVDSNDEQILDLAKTLAAPTQRLALANYFKNNFSRGEEIPGSKLRLVSIDKGAMNLMSSEAFANLFTKIHHKIGIPTKYLRSNKEQRQQFISQLSPFFSAKEMTQIRGKIMTSPNLSMDKDLLPAFARDAVTRHTIYKGPNCFHAALSFQSPILAASSNINVRQEQGYHKNMLNYDELWRAINLSFYEVDPRKNPIQYGDMIVLFETSGNLKPESVDFKTLRHAATYLMGGYVFAKGSKSANSPYIIRTLEEEWNTWTKYTVKLGAKVYRRNQINVTKPALDNPQDWVY